MRNSRMSSEECARACVRTGAVYILIDGDSSYVLRGDSEVVGRFAGQRVNITGTRQDGAILVDSASPLF
jgi:hypothetical protein